MSLEPGAGRARARTRARSARRRCSRSTAPCRRASLVHVRVGDHVGDREAAARLAARALPRGAPAACRPERLITQLEMTTSTDVVGERHLLDVALEELDVLDAGLARRCARARSSISSVMSSPMALPVGPTRRAEMQHVDAAARAEVEHGLALVQIGDRGRVRRSRATPARPRRAARRGIRVARTSASPKTSRRRLRAERRCAAAAGAAAAPRALAALGSSRSGSVAGGGVALRARALADRSPARLGQLSAMRSAPPARRGGRSSRPTGRGARSRRCRRRAAS